MAPWKVRRQTISQLRKAFKAMMSPEWDLALEGKSPQELTEAARALLAIQRARLRLGNAQLAEIRDALQANEQGLLGGMNELDAALAELNDVKRVIQATSALLATVGRVVDIVV